MHSTAPLLQRAVMFHETPHTIAASHMLYIFDPPPQMDRPGALFARQRASLRSLAKKRRLRNGGGRFTYLRSALKPFVLGVWAMYSRYALRLLFLLIRTPL